MAAPGRATRAGRLAAAVTVLAGAVALLLLAGGAARTGGLQPASLMHLATFTVDQNLNAARSVRGEFDHLPAKEDFLHAHADDRGGFPRAEYHKDDDYHSLSSDLSAVAKKVKLLSSRDQEKRDAAAKQAAADLSNYDSVFSSGIDEYAKISHSIDEQSRKVFMRSLKPKVPPKPAYDPLGDDRKVWKKMGVHADGVFGVPHEYAGWRATATSNPSSLEHLPDYVKRAQSELGGGAVAMAANGWHSYPIVPSRQQATAASEGNSPAQPPSAAPAAPSSPFDRAVGSYVPPTEAEKKRGRTAQAPDTGAEAAPDGAVDAQTLQSIVKAAVSKALKAHEAAEAQQHQAGTAVSTQSNIVWATAVPVTSTSPKAVRMSAAAAAAPLAAATDFAAPSAPQTDTAPAPAGTHSQKYSQYWFDTVNVLGH